ncbi:MAG: hypothetical protein OEV55_04430 [candidate division Zixibacteria bacterium]|nr:hypothetical protein [candidate division Zixibacteria bacterium]
MVFWSTSLFILGVMAFMDSLFNYGEIFRQVNTFMFMLISLGLLIRLRWERKNSLQVKPVNSERTAERIHDPVKTREKSSEPVKAGKKTVEVG